MDTTKHNSQDIYQLKNNKIFNNNLYYQFYIIRKINITNACVSIY